MKRFISFLGLMILALSALASDEPPAGNQGQPGAQATEPKITIDARNSDVRDVIHNIFKQAKRDYVADQSIKGYVYLSLTDAAFERALTVLCETANLQYTQKDGMYVFVPKPKIAAPPKEKEGVSVVGPSPEEYLSRIVYVEVSKQPLSSVIKTLAEQTKAPLMLDSNVPAYRVSMSLENKSLKFALNALTNAAPLAYSAMPDGTIKIKLKQTPNIESSKHISAQESKPEPTKKVCRTCKRSVEQGWRWCPWDGKFLGPVAK